MLEGRDMLTHGRFKVLPLAKADILSSRIAQDIAEQFYPSTSFLLKVERVSGPVHLSLRASRGFKANRSCFLLGTKCSDMIANAGVTATIAQLTQFLEVRVELSIEDVPLQQLSQWLNECIQF